MTQPLRYSLSYSFTDFSSGSPTAQPPGIPLDQQFNAIALTLNQLCDNIALIQRDDTKLRNASVGIDQLDPFVVALLGGAGFVMRGAWVTARAYAVGDVFTNAGIVYLVSVAHTSGVFATDLAAVKFVAIFDINSTALQTSLLGPGGAALIGTTGGITVQAALNLKASLAALAAVGGAALVGTAAGVTVEAALATRPSAAQLLLGTAAGTVGYQAPFTGSALTTIGNVLSEVVYVTHFAGADTTGVADSTAAFNAAIAYANAKGGNCTIFIPDGFYKLGFALNPVTAPYVTFFGSSPSGAVLRLSYNGPWFTSQAYGVGFENVQFIYPSAPGANAVVYYGNGSDSGMIRNCRVNNIRTLYQAGKSDGSTIGNALFAHGIKGNAYNSGSPCFNLYTAAGLFINDCAIYVAGVPNPTVNRTSSMVVLAGTSLIKTNGFTVDTIEVTGGCIFERWDKCFDFITPGTGSGVLNVRVESTVHCDYIANDCVHLEASAGTGGVVGHRYAGHMNSWSGRTISMSGAGVVRAINIDGIKSDFSGLDGVWINGVNFTDIHIGNDCSFEAADRLNTGTACGINWQAGDDITMHRVRAGYSGAAGGLAWGPAIGIKIPVDAGKYSIQNCDPFGTTSPFSIGVNTFASGNRIVKNNLQASYAGEKSGTAGFTVPASGVPWANNTPHEVFFTASGAGVSSIQLNGATVMLNNGGVLVQPGGSAGWGGAGPATVKMFVTP